MLQEQVGDKLERAACSLSWLARDVEEGFGILMVVQYRSSLVRVCSFLTKAIWRPREQRVYEL